MGYGGDDILFSSTKNNDTFTSNQIYLSLVYINELHLKHKMKHNFRIAASFVFCTNVSYGFSPKIQCEMLQSNFPFHNLFKISYLFKEMKTDIFEYSFFPDDLFFDSFIYKFIFFQCISEISHHSKCFNGPTFYQRNLCIGSSLNAQIA